MREVELGVQVARHRFIGNVYHVANKENTKSRRYYDNRERIRGLTIYSDVNKEGGNICIIIEMKLPVLLKRSKGFREFLKDFKDYIVFVDY